MVELVVYGRDGVASQVSGSPGNSLMETLKEAGFAEIQAICGGCHTCGTCHVYVDPAFAGLLDDPAPEERMVLEGLVQEKEESRLSCQIPLTAELEGMVVTIPPDESAC